VPNALPPGDLAVWDGHDAMVVGDGMMIKAGAPSGCRRSGPTNAGQSFQGFCVRPRERQPASWHLLDHLKVTFKAKRCRQGAVGYLKFWSRGWSQRAIAHGERNRNTITSTPRKPLGWRSRQTADRGVGFPGAPVQSVSGPRS